MLAVSAAFAGESSISGDVKLFYTTTDAGATQGALGNAGDYDLFDKAGSTGDAALSLDYSREVASGVTLNAGVTGISTLGLEDTVVSDVWVAGEGAGTNDTFWLDVANLSVTIGNTTAVIGRQKLDTPLAFTETWNIVENTFDAFTFVNSDLPEITLVASAVTRANGLGAFTNFQGGMTDLGDGIYAVGAVTKLIPQTVAQAWYYEANGIVDNKKVWLQADIDAGNGITAGVQYGQASKDSSIIAGQLGYAVDALTVSAAYSQTDEEGQNSFANYGGFGQSPVYTEAWWNFGKTTVADAQAMTLKAGYDLGVAQLGAQYTTVKNDTTVTNEMDELTLTAETKVGPFDAAFAYINTTADNDPSIDGNSVQVCLTAPFTL